MPKALRSQHKLLKWFEKNQRPMPWRKDRDPYRIWISEIMLQQTTVTAVIPFFERFMERFPNLQALADAPLEDVLEHWTGLGYYSRARNIHKCAQALRDIPFPNTYEELIQYPGLGPYSARAVTSQAFQEEVGVLDGNVIRFLSRFNNLAVEWWQTKARNELQVLADQWAKNVDPSNMNQALMELGATICTPKSPTCMLCPLLKECQGYKAGTLEQLPLPKPRKTKEIWIWKPWVVTQKDKVALQKNGYAPFLKGQWLYPGQAQKVTKVPRKFAFRHNITHHEIYVQPDWQKDAEALELNAQETTWSAKGKLHKWNPSALLTKVLASQNES